MAQPYVGEIRMFAGNFAPADIRLQGSDLEDPVGGFQTDDYIFQGFGHALERQFTGFEAKISRDDRLPGIAEALQGGGNAPLGIAQNFREQLDKIIHGA